MSFLGFLQSRVLGNIVGYGAGVATADVFRAPLRELAYELNELYPNVRHDPGTLAQLVARGHRGQGEAAAEAASSGLGGSRLGELVRLAESPPATGELLELLRRGEIDPPRAREGLRRSGVPAEWLDALLELRQVLLGPENLAGMVARDLLPAAEGRAAAARQGLEPADFDRLVRAGRRPPGPGEVLELLNRGELSEAEASAAIVRGGMEPELAAKLLQLRNVLPSPSDVVRFAVREVFTPEIVAKFGMAEDFPAQAVPIARRIGLAESELRLYWAAHWDLPSPTQGFQMFHRGLIDRPTLAQLLRALDVMPYWRDKLIQLAYNVPGRIDLRRMYQAGTITKPRLLRGYHDLGYSPEDAAILAEFAAAERTAPERDLVKTEVVGLYESRGIPRGRALEWLGELGYDDQDAAYILALADYRRDKRLRDAAVTVIRGRYLAREIDQAEALRRLDVAKVPAEERDELIELWRFQLAESPARLTEPTLRAAWRAGHIDEAAYRERVTGLGYSAPDVELLVRLYRPASAAPKPPPSRDLTRADALRLYKQGTWKRAEAEAHLAKLGYDAAELATLLDEVDRRKAAEQDEGGG